MARRLPSAERWIREAGDLRVLVVGLGSMGRRHLTNLRLLAPKCRIVVCRRSLEGSSRGAELADKVVDRLEDALAERPQAAIIATPASCHLETALRLAEQGVHLCIEKPIADRLQGLDELISLCQQRRVTLFTAYNFRFCLPLQLMQQALAGGRIGRLLSLRAEVGQFLPDWRPGSDYRQGVSARRELGGGVLLELSHELDYARWLAGEVETVYACAEQVSDLELEVEDLAEMTLRFASGAVGSIHLDMFSPAPHRCCRLIGAEGILEWNAITNRVREYRRAEDCWRDLHPAAPVDRNAMYLEELRVFLACAAGEAKPPVDGRQGRRVLELALAARESAREGRVVSVALQPPPASKGRPAAGRSAA